MVKKNVLDTYFVEKEGGKEWIEPLDKLYPNTEIVYLDDSYICRMEHIH